MTTIEEILRSGQLERLVGLGEDETAEYKGRPYDLSWAGERYELAKDVSAFANARGGQLLVGVTTGRTEERDVDVVVSVEPFSPSAFSIPQYKGIIQEHVYPAILGLEVQFVPRKGSEEGIGLIQVPPQHPDRGPFLIARVVEDGEYLKQIVAGYAERHESHNEPLSPKELQRRLMKGSDTVSERLGRIEEKVETLLDALGEPEADSRTHQDLVLERVQRILRDR